MIVLYGLGLLLTSMGRRYEAKLIEATP
jgi:hypothetical protein